MLYWTQIQYNHQLLVTWQRFPMIHGASYYDIGYTTVADAWIASVDRFTPLLHKQ